ncbi:hypothetical protein PFISCL1PPCAC_7579, partial [Pristionchus fissidentatus]
LILAGCFLLSTAQLERMSEPSEESEKITDNDKTACRELKDEYRRVCLDPGHRSREEEFCRAFDNVCIRLASKSRPSIREHLTASQGEDEQEGSFSSSIPSTSRRPDFTEFCRRFKNRYLFVCPNPFRFGQKAVVFCPIYSERCDVPLPDKPVVPQKKNKSGRNFAVDRLCASYANFASQYCSNALFLAQAQYRASCEKYWRFCMPHQ